MPMLKKIIIMIKKNYSQLLEKHISHLNTKRVSWIHLLQYINQLLHHPAQTWIPFFFFFNSPKITIKSEKWKIIQKSKSKNDPIQELTNIYIKEIYELTSCNRRGRWRGTAAISWLPCGHLLFSILKNWLFLTTSSHGTLASSLWFFALVNDAAKF